MQPCGRPWLLVTICCLLYCANADPRFSKLDVNDPPPDADLIEFQSILTVNSTNWKAVVEAVANADKQLMFSTFQGAVNGMLQMTANFYTWLHAGGLGNNVLFLSHDADSCRMLWKFGLPCWVDELCPRGDELPEGVYRHKHNHYFCKFWWALQLVQEGYDAAFMDNDAVVISNPWQKVSALKYDFEGLSDLNLNRVRPSPEEFLQNPQECFYKTVVKPDRKGNYAQQIEGYWRRPNETSTLAWAMVPCMSTGLWFAHPTPTTIALLNTTLARFVSNAGEWEQAAFQAVLVAYLLNLDDKLPRLRFRLLPHSEYANVDPYTYELERNNGTEAVVVHACCESNKQQSLDKLHLWQSDTWQPEWGREIVSNFQRCSVSPHGALCQGIKTRQAPAQATSQHAFHRHHAVWRQRHTPEAVQQAQRDRGRAAKEAQEARAHAEAPPAGRADSWGDQEVAAPTRLLRMAGL